MNKDTLEVKEYEQKRVGRPRNNWWINAIQEIWEATGKTNIEVRNNKFDGKNKNTWKQ